LNNIITFFNVKINKTYLIFMKKNILHLLYIYIYIYIYIYSYLNKNYNLNLFNYFLKNLGPFKLNPIITTKLLI
ncbi:MAG: hypothetical protein MCS20_01800, partial [Candidatus Phytoplasma mali]|nr:hypothetical protein [Candidatus Phytoplasma australiense]MBZ7920117.1 hypothetical protein [Candidatus Karelsulcia muelleri]MCG7202124.1 hypothetical protein [Candidatus Phytoplasma mali]MCZ8632620.1 hypothetical protein [Spiroplasma sp. Tabriz.8]